MNKSNFLILLLVAMASTSSAQERPNILWFVIDDMSANFSCYGEKAIETPNVDKLAEQGLLFTKAYATSPVCSTFRTALITECTKILQELIITEVAEEKITFNYRMELDPFLQFFRKQVILHALVVD